MQLNRTAIAGVVEIVHPKLLTDNRGYMIKTLDEKSFQENGLVSSFRENFYVLNRAGVLRGMHVQVPPHAITKLVHVVAGAALSVVVDLRNGSPTYGQHATFELSAEKGTTVYVPEGVAHGSYAKVETVMCFQFSQSCPPTHVQGIRWDSAGIAWPGAAPILSEKDLAMPTLADYKSPFTYTAT